MLARVSILALIVLTSAHSAEPIQAKRLRKDVSFLASDKLKGRGSPSPGLYAAGEYIAHRFWQMGLQPGSAGGYFQAIPVNVGVMGKYEVMLEGSGGKFVLNDQNTSAFPGAAAAFSSADVVKVDAAFVRTMKEGELAGKVVLAATPLRRIRGGLPAAVIVVNEGLSRMAGMMPRNEISLREVAESRRPSTIVSADAALVKWAASLPSGPVTDAKASGKIEANKAEVELRNVVGVLPGSDPALRDSYVIVSAHYDHLGEAASGTDKIRNGANDDASGVASMLGVAKALSEMKPRPKRTIVFAAWTAEEVGGLGSTFYSKYPLFPLGRTVANVNIEQIGRFDGEGGAGPKRIFATGYGYSDVGRMLTEAAKTAGVEGYAGPDSFFARSDNVFLALAGVPAHTVGSSLEFPDYHRVTDSADKLDYENMALLTRAVAALTRALADTPKGPEWNQTNPDVAPYRKARQAQVH